MRPEVVVGIDVGTTKICTLVGEVRPEDIFVVGVGVEPSRGMKKGVVNDVGALTAAISSSVHKAERSSGYEINRAFVSVAGAHIESRNSKGVVGISSPRGVQIGDLERAMDAARAIALPHNREVLHIIPRSFTLDGQEGVRSPLGMHGFRLEVEAHIVMASSSRPAACKTWRSASRASASMLTDSSSTRWRPATWCSPRPSAKWA
jgi:cell division protein FtsA